MIQSPLLIQNHSHFPHHADQPRSANHFAFLFSIPICPILEKKKKIGEKFGNIFAKISLFPSRSPPCPAGSSASLPDQKE